ncbi:MAG: CDGSH iron-sulfur domain-containing protein [Chloroherpetonaceae bacterium]|nr:CDGSH iron-sulfur domain-containing protein [Chloroherpetonaceae bacterium]MCS7210137.1 CDGSH iron-sulfur domain-containing protein [Chloroherpetonaceae bacterium]MDW8019870.1 CDGSH iron-sulfur domain-containing protein [Chloroherpetonaceae bacterium]MDW8467057.1 CDGSH iron-sulfur domain-containing protein [Chloroherpetonaceae bacterium]
MPVKITVLNNGPIKVEGDTFELCDAAGTAFQLSKPTIFLCRCGASQKKPFCDGSHRTCNFVSEVKAEAAR